eukprot:10183768-Lingulodinium_polyedra.AAC.1
MSIHEHPHEHAPPPSPPPLNAQTTFFSLIGSQGASHFVVRPPPPAPQWSKRPSASAGQQGAGG